MSTDGRAHQGPGFSRFSWRLCLRGVLFFDSFNPEPTATVNRRRRWLRVKRRGEPRAVYL